MAFAAGEIVVTGENGVYRYSYPQVKKTLAGLKISGKNEAIEEIAFGERIEAIDATVVFSPDGESIFSFTKERRGRAVDEEKLREDLFAALSVGGGAISPTYMTVEPNVTVNELKNMTFERARFTTYYENSSPERVNNVVLAAKSVSGTVVESGETFSFNAVVGERTEARGYKTAKIIKDGRFEEGLGGGVCQVSTTLYNAALMAGLEISEYHPHTLAVSYVENSFDAMVSFGSADLKFKNDTGGKIFIAAYPKDGSLTFVIFGEKNPDRISRRSVTERVIEAKTEIAINPELPFGEERVIVRPKNGAVSRGYLVVERNGKRREYLLRRDEYKSVNGEKETGAGGQELPIRNAG